ncbi:hypothetical protein ACO0QE_002674 [Hanseniaspora vineae]
MQMDESAVYNDKHSFSIEGKFGKDAYTILNSLDGKKEIEKYNIKEQDAQAFDYISCYASEGEGSWAWFLKRSKTMKIKKTFNHGTQKQNTGHA